jgi:hypothetical protein
MVKYKMCDFCVEKAEYRIINKKNKEYFDLCKEHLKKIEEILEDFEVKKLV